MRIPRALIQMSIALLAIVALGHALAVNQTAKSRIALNAHRAQDQSVFSANISAQPGAQALRQLAVRAPDRTQNVGYVKESLRETQTQDSWTRWIAIATLVILVIQGIAFFVQAAAMRASVGEMSVATKVAKDAAESARISADAAVNANTLNREAFLAERRPWVKFRVMPAYLKLGKDGWELKFNYALLNVGTAPAFNVQFTATMIPYVLAAWSGKPETVNLEKMISEATDVGAELRCFATQFAPAVSTPTPVFGHLLFPNDELNGVFQTNRADPAFAEGLTRRGYSGQLILLAGVGYKSALDQSQHYTVIPHSVFQLGQNIAPENGRFNASVAEIRIEELPLADSYAT